MTKLEKIEEMVNASSFKDKETAIGICYQRKSKRAWKAYELFSSGKYPADMCVQFLLGDKMCK